MSTTLPPAGEGPAPGAKKLQPTEQHATTDPSAPPRQPVVKVSPEKIQSPATPGKTAGTAPPEGRAPVAKPAERKVEPRTQDARISQQPSKTEQAVNGAKSWTHWGTEQASQAQGTFQQVFTQVVTTTWRIFTVVPFWFARVTWNIMSWTFLGLARNSATTLSWIAMGCTEGINRFSNLAFSLLLGRLRSINAHIDQLVEETPKLVRNVLTKARLEKMARGGSVQLPGISPAGELEAEVPATEGEPGAEQERKEEQRKPAEEGDQLLISPEDTDLARAANEALHRLFNKAEGSRETLLAEARKLAWHVWMLVALQVTAVRAVLRVTEGIVTWGASAWFQLAMAGVILGVMMAAAPVAAWATAFAWTIQLVLGQALWLSQGVEALRGYLAPSVHSAMLTVRDTVHPYLVTKPQPGEQQGVLQGYYTEAAGLLRQWLDQGEKFTASLLPTAQQPAKGEPGKPEEGAEAPRSAEAVLADACHDAEEASHKAYALAAAAICTVLDVGRVLLLGLATRFDLPMLRWVPGMYSGVGTRDPDVTHFLQVAGKAQS